MRDAVVAAMTLNIFNQESAFVSMANIAQIANVLQSMVLTEGEKMVLTPTYHVFDLYKEHQGATLLEVAHDEGEAPNGAPELSVSASMSETSRIHATFANLSYSKVMQVECEIQGKAFIEASAKILTGKPADFNDFSHPGTVSIAKLDMEAKDGVLRFELPPASVVAISAL
jgi:alpha-N-arabinofuranosidase